MKPTIGTRVLLGFGLIVALAVSQGLYSLYAMAELRKVESTVADRDLKVQELLRQVAIDQGEMRGLRERAVGLALLRKDMLTDEDPERPRAQWVVAAQRTSDNLKKLRELAEKFEEAGVSAERREQWKKIRQKAEQGQAARDTLDQEAKHLFEMLKAGNFKNLAAQMTAADQARLAFDNVLRDIVALSGEEVAIGFRLSQATYDTAKLSLIAGMIAVLVLGAVSGYLIQRSIITPLRAFMRFVGQVGQGELTHSAASSTVGE